MDKGKGVGPAPHGAFHNYCPVDPWLPYDSTTSRPHADYISVLDWLQLLVSVKCHQPFADGPISQMVSVLPGALAAI